MCLEVSASDTNSITHLHNIVKKHFINLTNIIAKNNGKDFRHIINLLKSKRI